MIIHLYAFQVCMGNSEEPAGTDILELLSLRKSYLTLSASADVPPVSPQRRITSAWKKEEVHH